MAVNDELINQYRLALLREICNLSYSSNGSQNTIQKLEEAILTSGGNPSLLESQRRWCNIASTFLKEAKRLADQGLSITSPEVVKLKRPATGSSSQVKAIFAEIFHFKIINGKLVKDPKCSVQIERSKQNSERLNYLQNSEGKDIVAAMPFLVSDSETINNLNVNTVHPNSVTQLRSSSSWTILIDESGRLFDKSVFSEHVPDDEKGKFVAVIVPKGVELAKIKAGFHSYYEPFSLIENAVNVLLRSKCGILGITANSSHVKKGDLWYVGLETLIDLILRLLPITNDTFLDFYIEQKSQITIDYPYLANTLCTNCLNRLARINPRRVEKISISAQFIPKTGHKWNGYADAVAFCWNAPTATSLLLKSGWKDSCLLGSDPLQLQGAYDALTRQEPLTEQEWNDLIGRLDAQNNCSLTNALLALQGEVARDNPDVWNRYLDYVQEHLYSKAIDMNLLIRQTEWLEKWKPAKSELPPQVELIWQTTRLAKCNHLGKAGMSTNNSSRFNKLCQQLYDENASLVCLADLHIAVSYMNAFRFDFAYETIKRWLLKEPAIPGLRYYAQVQSTVGQLNAFIGNMEAAVDACDHALNNFRKLSYEKAAMDDINQTSSYKVIAMMDSEPVPDNTTMEMEKYLGRTLEEAADQFAASDNDKEKYMHHVFLRYLVHVNSPELEPIIKKYLSRRSDWKTGYGHPWELILFYRALLLTDKSERNEYLELAYKHIEHEDGTLLVISCVILGCLYYYDSRFKDELSELTQKAVKDMPYLGEKRVEALNNQIDAPVDPMTLIKTVLPFNYR